MNRLFHDNAFGVPLEADPEVDAVLREVGMIQPQSPAPDRFEELDRLAERFGRDRGELRFPAREIRRLIDDDDWDFGPAIRARAEEVIAEGGLPEYPDEMRETFARLLDEHGIDAAKYLPE